MKTGKIDLKKIYWLVYALGFGAIAAIVFYDFYSSGRGFVWYGDGQKQHIVALVYYSEWLKQIVKNLVEHREWAIPMWDMTIGQGSDILTTLHYYAIGDPLNLLSVFVKAENMESFYSGLVLLRMFLTGISFSVYCFGHGKGRRATLIGSYLYCFSGFVLYNAIRHPYFINPMIYMPLMFLGIDKIYRKEKPYLFVFSTYIAAISNFYFFYMIVIACVCYALIVYKKEVGKYQWKEMAFYIGKLAMYGVLSVLLAAVVFVPNVMAVVFAGRLGADNYIPTLFELGYYEKLFASLVTQQGGGYSNRPGVAIPAAVALFVLFSKKGKRELKIGFLVLMTVFCVPYFGSMMNGLSYVSYRCSFIASFLLAYIFVSVCREMVSLTKKEKICFLILILIYIGIVLCLESVGSKRLYLSLIIFAVGAAVVFGARNSVTGYRIFTMLCLLVAVVGICMPAYWMYSPNKQAYSLEFLEKDTAVESASNRYNSSEQHFVNPSDVIRDYAQKDALARFEMGGCEDLSNNSAMLQGVNGISYYFSVTNPNISQFHKEMGLLLKMEFSYRNLGCRSYLQALNNVKYFVTNQPKYNSVLFRQDPIALQDGYSLYETSDNPGFAYAYNQCLPKTKYEMMDCVQKQEAVLATAVLDDNNVSSDMTADSVMFSAVQKPYVLETSENVEIEDGKIRALKKNASLTLRFEGDERCETYLQIRGLKFDAEQQWHEIINRKKKDASTKQWLELHERVLRRVPKQETEISVATDASKEKVTLIYYNEKRNLYCGWEDFVWNLGYGEKAAGYVTITFKEKGDYYFDTLDIYCQPVSDLPEKTAKLKVEGGDSFKAGTNSFSGHVKLDEKKYLCFSVPYSKGWSVYVNGEEKELVPTNTMFMSVLLDEGEYDIELKYVTPYLIEGTCATCLGLIILLLMVFVDIKNKKKQQKQ
nr:YfhO family protein [Lachnospiraceae bacterium]